MQERQLQVSMDAIPKWKSHNIVLTGASGSGKSTIGRQLAKLCGLGFIDTDELIELMTGKTIADIFESQGESAFRDYEMRALDELRDVKSMVVAVGAGALLSDEAIAHAREIGPIVWVQSSPAEIARRIFRRANEMEKRPLFKDLVAVESHEKRKEEIFGRVKKMMDERRPWYSKSDVVLDGSYVTSEMAAHHLKDILLTETLLLSGKSLFASWQRQGSE